MLLFAHLPEKYLNKIEVTKSKCSFSWLDQIKNPRDLPLCLLTPASYTNYSVALNLLSFPCNAFLLSGTPSRQRMFYAYFSSL